MKKLAKSGIKGLDKLLGGGIPRGTSILLLEEPGTKGATFAMGILCYGLKNGEYGQFISYDHPPDLVRAIADDIGFDVIPYEKEGKFQIIDGYTRVTGLRELPGSVEYVMDDLTDLSKVHRTFTLARASLGDEANNNLRFIHHTFSVLTLFAGDPPVLKFLRHLTVSSKFLGDIGIFILNPRAHSPTTVSWAMDFVDVVIDLSLEKGRKYRRLITIKKMSGVDYIMEPTPYELTHKGIIVKS